jgi:HlyD family secretion protein
VQVRVKVLGPDELLKPDMNATVSSLAPHRASSTTQRAGTAADRPPIHVPATAVRNSAVFVVENGRAVKRSVTVNKGMSGRDVEIRGGLIGGEDLIVSPPDSLQDGEKVKAIDSKTSEVSS